MHDKGPSEADVTEGSGGVWERLHYDWSDPTHVVLTTTDSNTWGGDSSHTYTLKRNPDGTTDVDYVVVREGKNLKGRVLGVVLGSIGKGRLKRRSTTRSRPSRPGTTGRERRNTAMQSSLPDPAPPPPTQRAQPPATARATGRR